MAQTLDFNKVKKNYFTVTLNDENRTRLMLMTPTKGLLEELGTMLPQGDDVPTEEDLIALYDLTARLMSRNKTGIRVTGEQLAEILDFEDLILFFTTYTDFIKQLANAKN